MTFLINPFVFGSGTAETTLADEILADSPIRYFPCQETTGTTLTDESGNEGDGTIVDGVTLDDSSLDPAPSGVGRYFLLDGTDGYLDLGSSNWFAPEANGFTLEGWFLQTANRAFPRYFDFNTGGPPAALDIELSRNNLNSGYRLDTGGQNVLFATPSPIGLWKHLVVTVATDGTAKLYSNGSLVDTQTVGAPADADRVRKWVGRSTSTTSDPYFPGGVTQIAVYNSVLPAARVSAHYTAGTSS